VAWSLAACGIGELHFVDGDTVELSNLNRQLIYTPADIGLRKVDVAAQRLVAFNPELRVRTTHKYLNSVEDIVEVIRGCDFVVRAIDSPDESQEWVNLACVQVGVPYIGGGFLPQGLLVGPMVIPGVSACLACNQQEEMPRVDRGTGGTLAPLVSATGGLLAAEVITYLGKLGPVQTQGRALAISAPTLGFSFVDSPRNEDCPVCGREEERRALA
jgi:molybdopterin/thiamine biosynthesis adenylyltransferase